MRSRCACLSRRRRLRPTPTRFEIEERKLANEEREAVRDGLAGNAALTRANGVQLTRQADRVVNRIDRRTEHTPEPDPVEVLRQQTAEHRGMPGIDIAVPRPKESKA